MTSPLVSVVIPFFNEAPSLPVLISQLEAVRARVDLNLEYIAVDDGSTDGGADILARMPVAALSVVRLRRNFGKSVALSVGFHRARGEVIVTMDADLQDDPEHLPALLAAVGRGYDVVSGWKRDRQDPLSRRIASRLYNALVGMAVGRTFRDVNSGFKAYRRWVVEGLQAYGENHRTLLLNAAINGARIIEVPISHRPRIHGKSKYNWNRVFSALMDFWWLLLSSHYFYKPLHFFGLLGIVPLTIGMMAVGWVLFEQVMYAGVFARPLTLFGALLILGGLQLISIGLIAEYVLALRFRLDNPAAFARWVSPYTVTTEVERESMSRDGHLIAP